MDRVYPSPTAARTNGSGEVDGLVARENYTGRQLGEIKINQDGGACTYFVGKTRAGVDIVGRYLRDAMRRHARCLVCRAAVALNVLSVLVVP